MTTYALSLGTGNNNKKVNQAQSSILFGSAASSQRGCPEISFEEQLLVGGRSERKEGRLAVTVGTINGRIYCITNCS